MLLDFDLYIVILLGLLFATLGADLLYLFTKFKNRKNKVIEKNSIKQKIKNLIHNRIFLLNLFTLVAIPGLFALIYIPNQPKILTSYPTTEGLWDSYSKPLTVEFNMPVSTVRLRPSINPSIKGTWVWEPYAGLKFLTRRGKFYPEETQFAGQRIVVYITGIGRIGFRSENHEFGFVFDSPKYPEFITTDPFNKTTDVKQDKDILLYLTKKNEDQVDFIYNFSPEVKFTSENISDYAIKLKLEEPLKMSQDYTLDIMRKPKRTNLDTKEVVETDNPELIHEITFTTLKEPLVKSFIPKGTGIRENALLKIKFEIPMDKTSVEEHIKINPAVEVEKIWDDSKVLILKQLKPLQKETKYTVTLEKGITSLAGGQSSKDLNFEFETIGAIQVSKFEPTNNQVKVNEGSNIKVTFDQEVDKDSAQNHLQITGGVNGDFSWDGNTMIFNPRTNLQFNTKYTVTLTPGIKSLYGVDSKDTFTSSFATRAFQVIISMPWYPQPQPSDSCNIFAAKMALAWKGYQSTTGGLIAEMGYDPNNPSGTAKGWTGDPYKVYVGRADGSWGYGVYWNPIRKLFTNRGIKTDLHQGWNIRDLAKSIEDGHPVIIWRYNGESADYDFHWTATDGQYVNAINGQHGGVVTGYTGTSDNPTSFYINDPWYGLVWINASSFDYYWSRLGRVGIVVY